MEQEKEILIPRHISRLAIDYSIPIILQSSLVSFHKEHFVLSGFQYFVYLTSLAHWSCIYKTGFFRNLDICAVLSALFYATFVSCKYVDPALAKLWYQTFAVSATVFTIDEIILYLGLLHIKDEQKITALKYYIVIMHMIFCHYGFSCCCMYCLLH
jgi:hypothetical protein